MQRLYLSTGAIDVLHNWPEANVQSVDIVEIDGRKLFLVSIYNLIPSEERGQVSLIAEDNNNEIPLFPGSLAVSIGPTSIAFFNADGRLSVVDLKDEPAVPRVIDETAAPRPSPVVPLSDTEFLYESRRSGKPGIWRHDLRDKQSIEVTPLNVCSLDRAVWRASTQQLLCHKLKPDGSFSGNYILAGLDGSQSDARLNGSGSLWPIAYVDGQDAVVVQSVRLTTDRTEDYPVSLYSFSTGELTPVAGDIIVGRHAIYQADP